MQFSRTHIGNGESTASVNALTVGPKSDGKETVEVRGIHLENEKAPATGHAVYVVVEQSNRKVLLLYPWNLQEFEISAEEFRTGVKESYWPTNTSGLKFDVQKLVDRIKLNVQAFALRKRTFPTNTVVKVLIELGQMSPAQVESWVMAALPEESFTTVRQRGKIGKQYRLAKDVNLSEYRGRPLVVLEAIQELGEASIRTIVDAVQGKLKSKLDHERVVVYFVNKFYSQGVLELIGEQMSIKQ